MFYFEVDKKAQEIDKEKTHKRMRNSPKNTEQTVERVDGNNIQNAFN